MASVRFEHLLAGTAIALALALTPYANGALAASDAEITAAVPMPESADLPPPSIRDIAPAQTAAPAATPAPATTDVTHSVPASDGAKFTTASVGDTGCREASRPIGCRQVRPSPGWLRKIAPTVETFYAGCDFRAA